MNAVGNTVAENNSRDILIDRLFKAGWVISMIYFVYSAITEWWKDPSRVTLILLVISGLITLIVSILSSRPTIRDMSPFAIFLALAATYYYPVLLLTPGTHLIPEWAGVVIQCFGIIGEASAKLSLGRSFGMLPAHRAVVIRGVYRFVRHPMYFGYSLSFIGFLLTNFGWRNLIIYSVLFVILGFRIHLEEKVLREADPSYNDYCKRVRYRVIPFVI